MSHYQLPPLKEEKLFEEFVCDLLNEIDQPVHESRTTYQLFGVKGQAQHGIDVYSPICKTVVQCKLKDVDRSAALIRKSLIAAIEQNVPQALLLPFEVKRFILVSTFRDDARLQQETAAYAVKHSTPFTIEYWGWDTLSRYAEQYPHFLAKHFPNLKAQPQPVKKTKVVVELPDGALGKDLSKKNYITFDDGDH